VAMKVTLAQTNPRLGDVHANLQDHRERIAAAVAAGSDLIVFPELSLTGYFLKDQAFELACKLDSPALAELTEASRDITIVAGFVERAPDGRLYNSLAFLERGEVLGVHRKVHLVSYGLFDEARDFAAGERFEIIESRLGRLGPLTCEDMWHSPSAYIHFLNNADALVVASASPARGVEAPGPGLASQRTWDTLITSTALLYRTWVVYAGRVGWEDGIGFGGASAIVDPWGNVVAQLDALEPGELEGELDPGALLRARVETPLRRDEKPWILAAELARHVPLSGSGSGSGREA
jgi:predicted amidohydrolase